MWMIVVGLLVAVAIAVFARRYGDYRQRKEREEEEQLYADLREAEERAVAESWTELRSIVSRHLDALRLKRRQMRRRDDYGNLVDGPWVREKEYFWDAVVAKEPSGSGINFWFGPTGIVTRDETLSVLDDMLDQFEAANPAAAPVEVARLSPQAFEGYCAELLEGSGWEAAAGGGPGDQGIDIVATRDGVKAVFQCKKYSQPVGNKAVQEALAGKSFASADLAFVVSNASFTPSAYALANTAGVFLVHYSQLEDLSDYLPDTTGLELLA